MDVDRACSSRKPPSRTRLHWPLGYEAGEGTQATHRTCIRAHVLRLDLYKERCGDGADVFSLLPWRMSCRSSRVTRMVPILAMRLDAEDLPEVYSMHRTVCWLSKFQRSRSVATQPRRRAIKYFIRSGHPLETRCNDQPKGCAMRYKSAGHAASFLEPRSLSSSNPCHFFLRSVALRSPITLFVPIGESKMHFTLSTVIALLPFLAAATPLDPRATFTLANGRAAQALNAQFTTLDANAPCTSGTNACVNGQFAQCANGKFVSFPCAGGLQCVALPLVNSPGTSITCDTVTDATTRIANTGATGGLTGRSLPEDLELARRAAFTLDNGRAAQALNAQFATLSPDIPCTSGDNACVNGQFAQCANGKFVSFPCAGGLQCVALPLVNSPGTSVTCDTAADAATRIATTGATGGLTGRDVVPEKRAAFTLDNGRAAQALNAKFATLSPDTPCTSGDNACVNGQFAQCANGKFVSFPCAGGLQCVALPLVNSPGTSVTCDTAADAATRIATTGATGGLTGRDL